jgi:tRNA threonylcarbamoyladenosine biosynthesis protein TsaE
MNNPENILKTIEKAKHNDVSALSDNLVSLSAQETFDFGRSFADKLVEGDIVLFIGQIGAGKTTCIKGVCKGLNVKNNVHSPTFTLINEYKGRLPVFHFDFYRIETQKELADIGLDEYLYGNGVCLFEWPEVIADALPQKRYEIYLNMRIEKNWQNRREISLKGIKKIN